jgi:universal stress protein E
MYTRLLVLLQGSAFDQPAVQRALTLSSEDTEILLLDAVYEPALEGYMGNTEIYAPLRNRFVRDRAAAAKDLVKSVKSCGARCRADVRWARLSPALLQDVIAVEHPDIVLMSPSTGRGWSHGDWQLVLTCPAPILVVQSKGTEKFRHVVAAVDPFHAHAKPAELDAAIAAAAKTLGAQCGAPLTVLHCRSGADAGAANGSLDKRRREVMANFLTDARLPQEAASLVDGEPDRVLEGLVNSGRADVIVMGALARGRFLELIVGHTAERVLQHGTGDVLVVKPAQTHA